MPAISQIYIMVKTSIGVLSQNSTSMAPAMVKGRAMPVASRPIYQASRLKVLRAIKMRIVSMMSANEIQVKKFGMSRDVAPRQIEAAIKAIIEVRSQRVSLPRRKESRSRPLLTLKKTSRVWARATHSSAMPTVVLDGER